MSISLTFHGAAGAVTGSCMELRTRHHRVLIDCGLFQGSRSLEALNYEPLPFEPRGLDLVLLTHAHLDHSGRLPLLIREGLEAEVWCTPPNRQLLGPLLIDAANIQAADADHRNERPDRQGLPPFEPLYDFDHVERLVERIHTIDYGHWAEPLPGLQIRFWDARHILGAASIELRVDGQALLFSGDIGIGADDAGPATPEGGWDHVVCEATYGDRDRATPSMEERRETLAGIVEAALARGGNLIIPSFAPGRTQAIIEDLVALFDAGRLRPSQVFVDAPLADKITSAYRRYTRPRKGPSPFDHPQLRFTRGVDESKALNRLSGAIILAGSGMCTGGRIRYHLQRNLPRGDSTVLFVGYQARGTLGAVLRGGARQVRISGSDVPVRASIQSIDSYSAHADHAALLRWLGGRLPVKGSVFLDHGEAPALTRLARDAGALPGALQPIVAALGESFLLDPGKVAKRVGEARPNAGTVVAEDWRNRLAAFRASLAEKLAALSSDEARVRALEAVEKALGNS